MKKFIVVMLILFAVFGMVFASETNKWSMGASFGTASMYERTFNDGNVFKRMSTLGIGADFRVDYEIVDTVALTGVVGWEMPDRTFLVGKATMDANEGKQHYITTMVGITKSKLDVGYTGATDIDWSITLGPQIWINATKGKVGGGATMLLKGAYFLSSNVSLDLNAKVSALGIKDTPTDSAAHLFTDVSVKAGCTYVF